jgi:catechol 2,3-dioxygenase-like lactoylglutathione lyase family enzyme
MLAKARVVPTVAVSDIERARRFYEARLGFEAEAVLEKTVRYGCGGGTGLAIFEGPVEAMTGTAGRSRCRRRRRGRRAFAWAGPSLAAAAPARATP